MLNCFIVKLFPYYPNLPYVPNSPLKQLLKHSNIKTIMKIKKLHALEILDSRGNPTVRTILELEGGAQFSASVPSGASTGSHEAVELRDEDPKRYGGKGVLKAVEHVNELLNSELKDADVNFPDEIDEKMILLDGTENKSKLGANAILSVSMAAVKAGAHAQKKPLWKFISEYYFEGRKPSFPKLMVNIVNGGKHAAWNFDIQEFMIVPNSTTPSESVRIASEIFHSLGNVLNKKGLSTLVGDEGGYSPLLKSNEEVIDTIIEAALNIGYKNVTDFRVSLDVASTEFFHENTYILQKSGQKLTSAELTKYYSEIGQKYNILSFEDAFAEDDWESWKTFADMAEKFQFVSIGDDLFVTNPKRIEKGIMEKAANGVLIKVNQIGTIKQTAEAIRDTFEAGWSAAISHRSGETEDSFIADLAYGAGAQFIKTGSMSRSERLAKYNRLLEIEKGL